MVTGGRSYLGELLSSVNSLRKHEPDLPILVFTDFAIPRRYELECEPLELADNAHKHKVASLRRSPFEETLFLDTDTTIRGSLKPLFDELKDRDFCAANAHLADYEVRPPVLISMVMEGEYNTGVLLFRKSEATCRFLERWETAVRAHDAADMWAGHFGDQYFFNNLLQNENVFEECGLRWGIVSNLRWNCRSIAKKAVVSEGRWSDVHILHQRTKGMKFRKLLFAITDSSTLRVLFGKAFRQAKKAVSVNDRTKAEPS